MQGEFLQKKLSSKVSKEIEHGTKFEFFKVYEDGYRRTYKGIVNCFRGIMEGKYYG